MPYIIEKRESKWCVKSTTSGKTHGCHDTRAEAIKQQRALYENAPPSEEASSESSATMVPVTGIPVKDMALLRLAVRRSEERTEKEVEKAVSIASGLSDPEVATQTIAVIGHLADRLRMAELNQAAFVDVIQTLSADSSASRAALMEALAGITERLAEAPQVNVTEAPQVNVTVPVPDVTVNVETPSRTKDVEVERDASGAIVGYRVTEDSVAD